ncbi:PREDICTED: SLAM family member 6 isoform X2 [Myotis brandtii]|uniref:SLAM family member 6 isoform X2 n=1 Tax=Myotis brandtii TaxID=109478 RepID=UPI0007043D37|nr:PREDICTED: SLAM family member 6 isoform X2 [Myotis brandtii]
MIWWFQFLSLLSGLGPGNTVSQTQAPPLLVDGVLGESVTLPLKFSAEEIQSITWLHKTASVIFILTEPAQIQVTDPKRKDRLKVIQSSSLQINNLTMADSGPYRAQITTATSIEMYDYNLAIYRRLRNLQVANHTQLFENGSCEIQLTCSVENPNDHASFRWQVAGNTILEEANLTISWEPKDSSEETYTCIAKNPVSNVSFSFSVQSLCKGVFNKKSQLSVILWSILVPSLICIVVSLIVWKKKKVAGSLCFSTQQTQSPAETPRDDSGNEPASPENTVYAQVTHPNMTHVACGEVPPLASTDTEYSGLRNNIIFSP